MTATAAAIWASAARDRGALRWGLLGVATAVGVPLAALLVVVVAVQQLVGRSRGRAVRIPGVPAAFTAIYAEAESAFNVDRFLLAAVHAQETDFNRSPLTFSVNAAGCAGPMQICVGGRGGCTWCAPNVRHAFRKGRRPASYPGEHTPHPSVMDTFDAVMGAAVILRDKVGGAPIPDLDGRAYRALCGYYGACADPSVSYAATVLRRARSLRALAVTSPVPDAPRGSMRIPLATPPVVSSLFCTIRDYEACHPGVDLAVPTGTTVVAAGAGRVSLVQSAAESGGYGRFVCVEHGPGLTSCYAHLAGVDIAVGDVVAGGTRLGASGCSGRCTGPHLHFEIRVDGHPTCPASYLGVPTAEWCAPGWEARST